MDADKSQSGRLWPSRASGRSRNWCQLAPTFAGQAGIICGLPTMRCAKLRRTVHVGSQGYWDAHGGGSRRTAGSIAIRRLAGSRAKSPSPRQLIFDPRLGMVPIVRSARDPLAFRLSLPGSAPPHGVINIESAGDQIVSGSASTFLERLCPSSAHLFQASLFVSAPRSTKTTKAHACCLAIHTTERPSVGPSKLAGQQNDQDRRRDRSGGQGAGRPGHPERDDVRQALRAAYRRSKRQASRSYQLRSLTFVQPARVPSR